MSRWLSNNPEDYTIGRLAVVPIDGNVCNNKIENLTLRQKEIV